MSASLSASSNVGLAPGTIVGDKYRIDGFLGAGGMGVVLSATHLELDAPVAIKIVRDDLGKNPEIVARLLFEARAAARMRGTHTVRILDVARLPTGAPYIVMERLEGADLQVALAERGAFSISEAVSYLLQACEGLAEAHGLGIIHRDLKPENLFLATTPEGVVLKILDFGISKDVGSKLRSSRRPTLSKVGTAVGSPYYMSPEQMRASPNLDARADIWSLGAILFEFVTGRCPFEAETPAALCTKVMCEEAPSLLGFSRSAPEQLDAIVRRCLQKEPSARFQTVTELAAALRDFTAPEALSSGNSPRLASGIGLNCVAPAHEQQASQPSEGDRERTFASRRSLLPLIGAGALLLMAGVGFWYTQSSGEAQPPRETRQADPNSGAPAAIPSSAIAPPTPTSSQAPPSIQCVISEPPAPPEIRKPSQLAATPHPSPYQRPAPTPAPELDGPATRYGL